MQARRCDKCNEFYAFDQKDYDKDTYPNIELPIRLTGETVDPSKTHDLLTFSLDLCPKCAKQFLLDYVFALD